MKYEQLVKEVYQNELELYEVCLSSRIKGLYSDNIIWINKLIPTSVEKTCVLAEELGHHHTTIGDILDQSSVVNRKLELRARAWAYEKLVPLTKIVQAHAQNITNRYELADFLNVTEDFLDAALNWYKSKFGLFVAIENYKLYFEPLGVLEMFDWIETPINNAAV
ncbi:membrane protein [Lysinibacillus sp. PLM2]|nr:membrane protein [Lysinibacillus sp. PLM2]